MANLLLLRSSNRVKKPALWRRRLFECKTCSRKFPSFQALGGHRTSHNRPIRAAKKLEMATFPARKKLHCCPVCGMEFLMGQALGGHMRRHRRGSDAATATADRRVDVEEEEEKAVLFDLNLPLRPVEFLWEEIPLYIFFVLLGDLQPNSKRLNDVPGQLQPNRKISAIWL